jgi:hypothetical protein
MKKHRQENDKCEKKNKFSQTLSYMYYRGLKCWVLLGDIENNIFSAWRTNLPKQCDAKGTIKIVSKSGNQGFWKDEGRKWFSECNYCRCQLINVIALDMKWWMGMNDSCLLNFRSDIIKSNLMWIHNAINISHLPAEIDFFGRSLH